MAGEGEFGGLPGAAPRVNLADYAKLWVSRTAAASTHGNEGRTRCAITLWTVAQAVLLPESHREHKESVALSKEILKARSELMASWAAEGGWDTLQFVKGMSAAGGATVVMAVDQDGKGGGKPA